MRRDKKVNPQIFYQHNLHNIQSAQKHYQEVYKSKMNYINESLKSLNKKKDVYSTIKYHHKLYKLNNFKRKTEYKLKRQQHKIKYQMLKLESR